ncbi:MAG: hypothetical protein RLZZ385_273 [Pseudomonadota bacterium]|jgi:lysophospholipase
MFSIEDARELRQQLPALDFVTPVLAEGRLGNYLDHYGLSFASPGMPVTHSLGYFPSQEFRIACHYFGLPLSRQLGTVFILHGYYDHAGLYGKLIRYCLERGLAVVIPDLPGHGLSSGDAASIRSFDQYSRVLQDCLQLARRHQLHEPWHVIGQSTGAAAIVNLLVDAKFDPAVFHRIVLLAPLLRPSHWLQGRIKYYLVRWFTKRAQREFAENSHDREFLRFIRLHDPLQSRYLTVDWVRSLVAYLGKFARAAPRPVELHIIQGTEDGSVDWRYNVQQLGKKFPNAKTYMIRDARHHIVNESPLYWDRVTDVLDNLFPQVP